jgi:hypothetical protein
MGKPKRVHVVKEVKEASKEKKTPQPIKIEEIKRKPECIDRDNNFDEIEVHLKKLNIAPAIKMGDEEEKPPEKPIEAKDPDVKEEVSIILIDQQLKLIFVLLTTTF